HQDPPIFAGVPGPWHASASGTVTNRATFPIVVDFIAVTYIGGGEAGVPVMTSGNFPGDQIATLAPGATIGWTDGGIAVFFSKPTGATAKPDIWGWANRDLALRCPSGL